MINVMVFVDSGIEMKIKNEEPTDEELIAMRKELINMLSSMTVPELREFLYLDID